MSDDLVKRLRFGVALDDKGEVSWCTQEAMFNAADRIELLEVALQMSEKRFETLKQAYDCVRQRNIQLYGSAVLEEKKDER